MIPIIYFMFKLLWVSPFSKHDVLLGELHAGTLPIFSKQFFFSVQKHHHIRAEMGVRWDVLHDACYEIGITFIVVFWHVIYTLAQWILVSKMRLAKGFR